MSVTKFRKLLEPNPKQPTKLLRLSDTLKRNMCFVPKGRSGSYIYAVALREHSGVVKVGRTKNWNSRRKPYANWNLAAGDAISEERVFTITEDFIDLKELEGVIIDSMPFPVRHGNEWFVADFDEVCRHIDRVLCEHGISAI